jgi:hypothetical protein
MTLPCENTLCPFHLVCQFCWVEQPFKLAHVSNVGLIGHNRYTITRCKTCAFISLSHYVPKTNTLTKLHRSLLPRCPVAITIQACMRCSDKEAED